MVNYPNGRKGPAASIRTVKTGAGRRGMELEKEISMTNEYYLSIDKAVIHKKPTPVTIVKVDYPMRSAAKITEAYFKLPSTTDYNGIYRSRYIDFEAKECHSITSFPTKSIHAHQINHLESVTRHGAIAFVIVRFTAFDETFYIVSSKMTDYIRTCGRSSIPYSWFKENGYRIPYSYVMPVDYLQIIDQLYFKEKQ
ncbi:MAG: Holliday junction resolvase RecU [Erysipelotrichia bacterium]|nr:Holliday junction resolvase RecU [Erysipelotrichia bacterium]